MVDFRWKFKTETGSESKSTHTWDNFTGDFDMQTKNNIQNNHTDRKTKKALVLRIEVFN